jgi:hypothetical protein
MTEPLGGVDAADGDDLDAIRPTPILLAGGVVQAVAGLLLALYSIQNLLTFVWFVVWMKALPWLLLVGGVALVATAGGTYKGRLRATLVGAILCAGMTVVVGGFTGWLGTQGAFSCLGVLAPGLLGLAAVLGFAGLPAARRIEAARTRLTASGMSLGF